MTVLTELEFLVSAKELQKAGSAEGGCRGRRGRVAGYRSRSARGCRQPRPRHGTPHRGSLSAPAARTLDSALAPAAKVAKAAVAAAPAAGAAAPSAGAAASTAKPEEAPVPQVVFGEVDGAVVAGLGRALERRLLRRKEEVDVGESWMFHSTGKSAMSVSSYITRLKKYMACSTECFVVAMVYIDRAVERQPGILAAGSALRLVLTCMTLAAKFHDDTFYANSYYAKVGGVGLKEINKLEAQLLQFLDWKLTVTPEVFEQYSAELCRLAQGSD